MIVPTLLCLVTEEVNLVVVLFDKLKAESLVPAFWENIEGYLAADGVCEVVFFELRL